MSKKNQNAGCGTLMFWLFIGWWLYPMKWICIDLPKALIKMLKKQSSQYSSEFYGVKPAPQDTEENASAQNTSLSARSQPVRSGINVADWLHMLPFATVSRDGTHRGRNFAARDLSEFKCKNLTARTSLKNFQDFVAFDTETTGIDLTGNRIIEVACVRFVNFVPVSVFTTLINPECRIPAESIAIHHITDNMVANAPKFYEIIPSLDSFIGKSTLVAHNAMFDVRFLYADGLDSIADKKVYDTLEISRNREPDQTHEGERPRSKRERRSERSRRQSIPERQQKGTACTPRSLASLLDRQTGNRRAQADPEMGRPHFYQRR